MRILTIGHSLVHPRQALFWEYVAEQGHHVLVLAPKSWGDETPDVKRIHRYVCEPVPVRNEGSARLWYTDFSKQVEEFEPDIVYVQQEPWTLLCKVALSYGKPTAVFSWENISKRFTEPYGKIEQEVIASADMVVAGTNGVAEVLAGKGRVKPVVVCPQTGVNTEIFKPLGAEKIYDLIFAGRLVPPKGVATLLSALLDLSDVKCLFVGKGVMEEEIKKQDNCTVVPWVQWEKLAEYYNQAKILVMPSYETQIWKEQFGYAMLEAMACGLNVVGTASGAIPEVLRGSDSMLVAEKHPADLAEAIRVTLEHPVEPSLCRAWVEGKYSYGKTWEKLEKAFEAVV